MMQDVQNQARGFDWLITSFDLYMYIIVEQRALVVHMNHES